MRFGIYLVVAVDVADYLFREKATLGQLLGALTVDISSVWLASVIGSAAGSAVAGYARYRLDQRFHIGDRIGKHADL